MQTEKDQILAALTHWIHKRPQLEYGNYGCPTAYRSEARSITRDLHHARQMLKLVSWRDSITADDLLAAARMSYSGRLSLVKTDSGYTVDYCTGQYWPTEYRRAACAVLASALWFRFHADLPADRKTRDEIRRTARRELSTSITRRWFN
jgi:Tfp pilus assembly protein PilV